MELSCDYLQRIDVQDEESKYDVDGKLAGLMKDINIPICVNREVFQ